MRTAGEETQNPTLRGKPFAVGGRPDERGVVASCSYAARALGIRSAMPMSRAIRLCGNLIIIPGRHKLYGEFSVKDNRIANFAKALAHPARVAILRILLKKESCYCGDIVEELAVPGTNTVFYCVSVDTDTTNPCAE